MASVSIKQVNMCQSFKLRWEGNVKFHAFGQAPSYQDIEGSKS